VPAVRWLRRYERGWLRDDLLAGIILAAVLVPVGMGYAQAAGLPPETGLYATIGPLLAYAVLGPSRILVLGPDSALAPLIAAAVLPLAAGDPQLAIGLAGTLALLTGAVAIGLGVAGFGLLSTLLSHPVRVGYLNGIAVVVIVSQLPALLGFSVDADGAPAGLAAVAEGVAAGRVQPAALAIGGGALVLIIALRRVSPRIPAVPLAVVAAVLAVVILDLGGVVGVVGSIPRGLPDVALPPLDLDTVAALLPSAVGIALVSFADTSVLSRALAPRDEPPVDQDRELVALGAADVVAGVSGGFPVSSSASRTPVALAAGSRTQLTGVVAAVLLVGVLLALPDLFVSLPTAALAAVVIASGLRLIDVRVGLRLARTRPSELALLIACFAGVVVLGVLEGVVIAVGLALLDFIRRAWRPYDAVLGRLPGRKGYHDASRHGDAHFVPGLLMFRFDAPLFFANADLFRDRVVDLIADHDDGVRTLLLAAEPVTDVDATAAEMLEVLVSDLQERGIGLYMAEMKGPVKDCLRRYGLYDRIGDENFFPTVGSAVRAHVERSGVHWQDPEDSDPEDSEPDAGAP
jgi:high affinity sulfate transporter 1